MSTVTDEQRQLTIELHEGLTSLLEQGTISLLTGKANPEEAIPILNRLIDLLNAAGYDTQATLSDALTIAQVLR